MPGEGQHTQEIKWRKTFAVWPVRTISGRVCWLQIVYRRQKRLMMHDELLPEWSYATADEIIQQKLSKQ